jgi:hypothetical protein
MNDRVEAVKDKGKAAEPARPTSFDKGGPSLIFERQK